MVMVKSMFGPRSRSRSRRRHAATAVTALMLAAWWSAPASAQLDPLLFLKRVPPTVIIIVDTSLRMLEDGSGYYYDPNTYTTSADGAVASAFGLDSGTNPTYRRRYKDLQYENIQDSSSRFQAVDIQAMGSSMSGYSTFWNSTRLQIAKSGIESAVSDNAGSSFRWGLIKLRQTNAAWRVSPSCEKPVRVTGNVSLANASDATPCAAGSLGKYGIYTPSVSASNYGNETILGGGAVKVAPGDNKASAVLTVVRAPLGDSTGLIPAGSGASTHGDRPISHALDDARRAAVDAMAADSAACRTCRNTIVVLITGGKDDGDSVYTATHNPVSVAATFLSVTSNGVTRRVPIHVIGLKPAAADEPQLQSIASASGGLYTAASTSADVARALNYAVQTGFSRSTDFDTNTTSEFLPVSPVVGTVNLKNASDVNGNPLPNTDIVANPGGQALPQRSNMLLSAGFTLPGFDGVLRAFRTFRPEVDTTKPSGWKFVNDGTKLWPDLDGRPSLAGMARVPADPNTRNIYTFVPNATGGGSVVAFTTANLATLSPHLNAGTAAADVISAVRAQAIGAIIGSTPAIMDPPSLDPAPDDDYGRTDAPETFAGEHKDRRSIIFFGANDGMIHAVDARTGYEIWAFIPYNLLPKLRALSDGQPIEQFDYFVDSSPKIAEVKLAGAWRSLLIIGQGNGGTFYQTFDVTEAGMNVSPELDGLSTVSSLLAQFDNADESIQFKWSFPNYSSFDPTYTGTFTVADATPGGRVKIYGDLRSTASFAEKTVGFSWSDPAVGTLKADRSITAVIAGSGYFPAIESFLPGRGATAPRAGSAMYLIDANTGTLIGNAAGATCPTISNGSGTGRGCALIADGAAAPKNALQADPTASGVSGSFTVNRAYIGDLDGQYWKFNFDDEGDITVNAMGSSTGQPIYASSALLFLGSADVYMFFATGSDLLPSSAPGGTGTFRLFALKDNGASASVNFTKNLATVTNTAGLATGERASTAPSVAGEIVFYTTTTESAAAPCADFSAKLYGLTYKGGAAYDANNDGKVDTNETPVVKTLAGRATAPFIVDQHLYFGSAGATGANVEAFGDPEDFNNGIGQVGVRILSWREIR
jgi:hypothetical protein